MAPKKKAASRQKALTRNDVAYWAPHIGKDVWLVRYQIDYATCMACGHERAAKAGLYSPIPSVLRSVGVNQDGHCVLLGDGPGSIVTRLEVWLVFRTEKEAKAAAKQLNAQRGRDAE